jgi:small subunit ribosomal protein S16
LRKSPSKLPPVEAEAAAEEAPVAEVAEEAPAEEPAAEEANEATPNSDAGDDAAAVTGESAQEPAEGSADEAEKAE